MMNLLRANFQDKTELAAFDIAAFAHDGQTRKGTGLPYIVHPVGVALILRQYEVATHDMVAAGLLHDTVEDTRDAAYKLRRVTQDLIAMRFEGTQVPDLVLAMTTPLLYDGAFSLNKAGRDAAEIKRLCRLSDDAKTLKLADIYHNISEIMATDPIFAIPYLLTKERQMPVLIGGNKALWANTYRLIQEKKYWMYKPKIEEVEIKPEDIVGVGLDAGDPT